jgi:hypothetical protein
MLNRARQQATIPGQTYFESMAIAVGCFGW